MRITKFISLLAATAMTVTAVTGAMSVTAVNSILNELKGEVLKGKCGESAEWLINTDGVLVISGTGEMSTYADDQSTEWGWRKYGDDINKVVVEDGITVGSLYAFFPDLCKHVSEIILPPSLTRLNGCISPDAGHYINLKDIYVYSKNTSDFSTLNSMYSAWSNSDKVWHVYQGSTTETSLKNDLKLTDENIEYIPDNKQMPHISNKTPAELEPVTETSGPSGLTSKYEYNESSKTLTFSGKGTISIADNYQKYAKETEHIVIESGITKIFAYTGVQLQERVSGAFYGFTELNDVKLPDTLTEIGELSFYETPLANINFPEGLEQIGILAFYKTNLEDISFPNSLKRIDESAFTNSKIKSIKLHEGMTIGGGAFYSCESLKEVAIPQNITLKRVEICVQGMSREPNTFGNCTGLEKIIIEDGSWLGDSWDNEITPNGIPDQFCRGCTSLKTVIIKGDVEYIGLRAFGNCTKLTDIYLYNTGLTTITAKGTNISAAGSPASYTDSFDTTNNPTFHVVKGSITEQTLRDAGYLTDENTVYLTDFTALDEKIKEADNLDTSNYTDDSVAALKSAIDSGKTVLANENATQDEVDKAVNAITAALSGLAKKPAQSAKPSTDNKITNTKSQAQKNAENAMKQAKITKLTAKSKAKKKITVTWKKVSKANGYQVQVSTNKKFKKSKIILTKTTSKKKITIKKLKSKKTYFVRVRAYATYKDSNGKPQKVYSSWIKKTRKVKVK